MSSPASSRPESLDLAVVALAARALAASARKAGLRALAIDLFADEDTREHAALAVRAPANRRGMGFDRAGLLDAIAAHAPPGLPVVLGAGFEHAPGLMRAIARRNPILGASPETVGQLKDPVAFEALLSKLDIPHPAVGGFGAASGELRLSKRAGASGGAHIRNGAVRAGGRRYLQTFVPGHAISALFLADGRALRIIGFSEQWTDPAPRAPFRYGGAVGPIELSAPLRASIAAALDRIVGATGLRGLASADMIVGGDDRDSSFQLIEINPRPGATLDVFDHGDGPSLLALHIDACEGRLPGALPVPDQARAAAIVYAERPVEIVPLRRPLWTADWPSCDESLPVGAPVCTVLAAAASPSVARALVMERRAELLASFRAATPAPTNAMVHA